jgi:hypothetical protein
MSAALVRAMFPSEECRLLPSLGASWVNTTRRGMSGSLVSINSADPGLLIPQK